MWISIEFTAMKSILQRPQKWRPNSCLGPRCRFWWTFHVDLVATNRMMLAFFFVGNESEARSNGGCWADVRSLFCNWWNSNHYSISQHCKFYLAFECVQKQGKDLKRRFYYIFIISTRKTSSYISVVTEAVGGTREASSAIDETRITARFLNIASFI